VRLLLGRTEGHVVLVVVDAVHGVQGLLQLLSESLLRLVVGVSGHLWEVRLGLSHV